jgi:transcriptional regulator with XRE-family HTH domain
MTTQRNVLFCLTPTPNSDNVMIMAIGVDFGWSEVGGRIRARRLALGKSQQELAGLAGLTQNAIFRLEAGDTNPQIDTLRAVSNALKTSVRELVCGVDRDDKRFGNRMLVVKSVLNSGDDAAIRAMDYGLQNAQTILDRTMGLRNRSVRESATNPRGKLRVKCEPDDDLDAVLQLSEGGSAAARSGPRKYRGKAINVQKGIKGLNGFRQDTAPHLPMGNAKKIALPESNGKKGQYERANRGAASAAPITTQR